MWVVYRDTLQGTNISPYQGMFEDEFPFPKVAYVSFLESSFPPRKKLLDFQLENDDWQQGLPLIFNMKKVNIYHIWRDFPLFQTISLGIYDYLCSIFKE